MNHQLIYISPELQQLHQPVAGTWAQLAELSL
jgi:hypothetical protein